MAGILVTLLNLISFVFLAAALASWFRVGHDSPFRPVIDGLYRITDPVLVPLRRVIPPIGGLDLSPLFVLIGLQAIQMVLMQWLPRWLW